VNLLAGKVLIVKHGKLQMYGRDVIFLAGKHLLLLSQLIVINVILKVMNAIKQLSTIHKHVLLGIL
jgi:hypothetical protein